jgi:hypothetical protein
VGRLLARSRITLESRDLSFAVLHFGDQNVIGGVRPFAHVAQHVALHGALTDPFSRADLTEVLRVLDRLLPRDRQFTLSSLFQDEQAKMLEHPRRDALRYAFLGLQ